MDHTEKMWNNTVVSGFEAVWHLMRFCYPHMKGNGGGRIINISSVIGLSGNAGQANYAASKAGIIAMSKSLAKEVAARGVTVNCVAPGYIDTPMTQVLNDDIKNNIISHIPAKRIGIPKDVSSAVIFLASNESSYINGHTLSVNGGMLMS